MKADFHFSCTVSEAFRKTIELAKQSSKAFFVCGTQIYEASDSSAMNISDSAMYVAFFVKRCLTSDFLQLDLEGHLGRLGSVSDLIHSGRCLFGIAMEYMEFSFDGQHKPLMASSMIWSISLAKLCRSQLFS